VTRTSDVRPELLTGCFTCGKCGIKIDGVEQQFIYTPPSMCNNPRCDNKGDFTLMTNDSVFVDWQRLRVQENSEEIPPGSMPRSTEIIVRSDVVETAKAGDKCTFTGYMAVVPDASGLARAGETASASKGKGASNDNNGIRGLRSLGVKELTYKTCFIGSSVIASTRTASAIRPEDTIGAGQAGGSAAEQAAMEFSMEEREDIRRMKGSRCVRGVRGGGGGEV
jgi:DNA replication licensing factor MCM6